MTMAPRNPWPSPGRRIVVVGTTGVGKTALARRLARHLGLPHIELDALNWEPGWVAASLDTFRARVAQALAGETWVVDGNYSRVRDLVWSRADTVIWLDYALPVILGRLLRRTIRRIFTREVLWAGNRETFRGGFLSRDSLFLWALRTYGRRKREYPALFQQPEYAHLTVIRLRSPRQTRRWLRGLGR
ncbi:MAG: AAA family ATPase [Chloroflexia bacterium]